MEKTNYVASDVTMRWLNKSVTTINAILQFLDILAADPRDAWEYINIL